MAHHHHHHHCHYHQLHPQYHLPSSFKRNNYFHIKQNSSFNSDEFRMFNYKVDICPTKTSHDWTSCPFAHEGERAKRRDPVLYNYAPVPCEYEENCPNGDSCGFAHGIFEFWLHPARYRSFYCNIKDCNRKVCFFAHNESELRIGAKKKWYSMYKPYFGIGADVTGNVAMPAGGRSRDIQLVVQSPAVPIQRPGQLPGTSQPVRIMKRGEDISDIGMRFGKMKINDNEGGKSVKTVGVWDIGFNLDLSTLPSPSASASGSASGSGSSTGSSSKMVSSLNLGLFDEF